jgi:hypothetical protein
VTVPHRARRENHMGALCAKSNGFCVFC